MGPSAVANAGDPKQVKEGAKIEKRTRNQELSDLRFVMESKTGRRFFFALLSSHGIYELSYTRGDTHETAFREGMRNIGNKLLADCQAASIELYAKMIEENKEEAEDDRSGARETGDNSTDA